MKRTPNGRGRRATLRSITRVAIVIAALVAACAPPPTSSTSRGYVVFAPSAVAPDNTLSNEKVSFAGSPSASALPKDRLVVLFGGTSSTPLALSQLGDTLISEGYHVLGVSYDARFGTTQACPDTRREIDPECHRTYKSEIVFGEGVADPNGVAHDHELLTVSAPNSAMGSLIKHIEYAHSRMPERGWDQYLQMVEGICVSESVVYGGCEPRWEDISLMGFSQGGGLALFISKYFTVPRVGMLAAPYDVFGPRTSPMVAPWIAEGGFATPPERMTILSHTMESEGWRYTAVADALGIVGPDVDIRHVQAPFGGSGRLVSGAEPLCLLWDSWAYHGGTATNGCADPAVYADAWRHMAD